MKFDSSILATLACPVCKGALRIEDDADEVNPHLCCDACAVRYPVQDGIPDLLPESGRSMDEEA
ncbi:MAG: Trm112 family protein [bacterium]|nr:Trm112 family protein [bacterium]